jgi:hypothetical protein
MAWSRPCPQSLANHGTTTFTCRPVGSIHRRDRRSETQFPETSQHLNIVAETALPWLVPGDLIRGVLAKQGLSLIRFHGSASR